MFSFGCSVSLSVYLMFSLSIVLCLLYVLLSSLSSISSSPIPILPLHTFTLQPVTSPFRQLSYAVSFRLYSSFMLLTLLPIFPLCIPTNAVHFIPPTPLPPSRLYFRILNYTKFDIREKSNTQREKYIIILPRNFNLYFLLSPSSFLPLTFSQTLYSS